METDNNAPETNNAHEDISHDVPDLSAWLSSYAGTPEYLAAEKLLATIASVELGGFWGSALAFFLATWRSRAERGSLLVITPNQDEADQLFDELEVFSDERVLFFPPWESLFLPDSEPEGDIYSRRLDVLDQLASRPDERCIVVAPIQAVLQPVPFIETLRRSSIELRCGQDLEPAAFAERLIRYGFRNVSLVEGYGEFSMRGDVFDFFPYQGEFPLRVEFFGDTIDSIRRFRPETQRSVAETETDSIDVFLIESADVFRDCFRGGEPLLTDYLGEDGVVCLQEPQSVQERAGKVLRNLLGETHREVFAGFNERLRERRVVQAHGLPVAVAGDALNLQFGSVERFRSTALDETFDNVRRHRLNNGPVLVFCESTGERSRFREIIADQKQNVDIDIHLGGVRRGFEARALSTAVLTTRELFNRNLVRKSRKKTAPTRALDSFIELSSGDYVVHVVHGIARFLGMESFNKSGVKQQFLALEFRGGVKIYVPVSKIDLVQKYIGAGDKVPILDKIGGASWVRKKELVETALLDLASELLQIHAFRKERTGIRYPEDSEWQREFEAAFPFQDTPDQATTIDSIKEDMRSGRPMDRLICGDVGYGKTELSIRAAFKAVESGKQVAILVPTTVLAQQHFRTFSERVAGFPVTVDVLSRFRSRKEQKQVLSATAEGKVDILIGTHRLLSEDVVFRDLGLAIVDEEQRFGVAHKEKFKKLRATVDVLTLTATPIPRTLHMSMLGIRDISSLRTPPQGRTPVRTEVIRFEPEKIREIIIRELNRDGQVFFVHNRIHDIEQVKFNIEKIVPEARVAVAHGRMKEDELERIMVGFISGEFDILLSTTIVENGIDIPNCNTIFLDEADRYGLSEMHQLRGRVGRYKHQAYCYLVLPEHRHVNPDAEKRLQALVEFSDLGAGFQIAMRDLEIRGAGNILGPEQSGHIAAVGYDMYCRLLEKAVRTIRKEDYAEPVHVEVDLGVQAFVPDDYLPGEGPKLEVYRRVSQALDAETLENLADELTDRFGPLPNQVRSLIDIQQLRVLCAANGIESIGRQDGNIILQGRDRMKKLLEDCPVRVTVLDGRTVAVSLRESGRRRQTELGDQEIFGLALKWLQSTQFPIEDLRPKTLGTMGRGRKKATSSGEQKSRKAVSSG